MEKMTERQMWEKLNETPLVKRLVEDELRKRQDAEHFDEPMVTFSIRLGAGDMALLENLGSYMGYKKTPFASVLLHYALEDALNSAMLVELDSGRLDELKASLGKRVEFEDGYVETNYGGKGA